MLKFLPKKSRWGFVLGHAATGGVIDLSLELLGAPFIAAIFGGLLGLVMKEFGENVGRAKTLGTFENNFQGNKAEFIDAIDDKWQLWQTVGAMCVFVVVRLVLKLIFGV